MNIPTITRQQLEIINRKTLRYPLHIAEKDYFLALTMLIISQSPLGRKIIFKGGTALHHCYLEQHRFSEDLDFSSNQKTVSLPEIRQIFAGIDCLNIKKDYQSKATVKIERLQYSGPLIQPNCLKVEIDYLQNVLLVPQTHKYHNVWGIDFNVIAMNMKEICAEKIRAMSDRARFRDFYDLFLLLEKYQPDLAEIVSYIKKKEIRKPVSKINIVNNWRIVETQKAKEMDQIYYSRQVTNKQIKTMINKLPFIKID